MTVRRERNPGAGSGVVDKGAVAAAVQGVVDLAGTGGVAHQDQIVAEGLPEGVQLGTVGAHAHRQDHGVGGKGRLFAGLGVPDGDAGLGERRELFALGDLAAVLHDFLRQVHHDAGTQ